MDSPTLTHCTNNECLSSAVYTMVRSLALKLCCPGCGEDLAFLTTPSSDQFRYACTDRSA